MRKIPLLLASLLFCCAALAQEYPTRNVAITVLPAATITAATVNSDDQNNNFYSCGQFIVYVSTATTGNYTPHIQGKNPISGLYYDILVGSAISTTGTTVLKVCPGIGVVANGSAADIIPKTWRVQLIGASTPNMLVSVYAYIGGM